jgi:hypothetical protein
MTPEQAGSRDPSTSNREAWLQRAAEEMKGWFVEIGEELPPVWVSIGFGASKRTAVGTCHPRLSSEDGINHVFVSPVRGSGQSVDALATLLHELVHAVDDCQDGHTKNFIRLAKALGFKAKWTSSANRTDELTERLEGLVERIGPVPHGALTLGNAADAPKKQGTRMLKVECPVDGYVVRTTQKWLDVGNPTCPCGTEMGLA